MKRSRRGELGFEEIVRIIVVLAVLILLVILSLVFKDQMMSLASQVNDLVRFW